MQDGAKRKIPQIRRRAVLADDPVGEHGEWMRWIAEELTGGLHAQAATAIHVIHKRQHALIRVRLFQSWKRTRFGAKDVGS